MFTLDGNVNSLILSLFALEYLSLKISISSWIQPALANTSFVGGNVEAMLFFWWCGGVPAGGGMAITYIVDSELLPVLPIPESLPLNSATVVRNWMFKNARNTIINGGTFTVQGDFHSQERGEHAIQGISAVKQMLIVVHSNEAPAAIYCRRCISQFRRTL